MGVRIVHALNEHHIADLVRLYRGEWWCRTREEADVRRMLEHSDVILGLEDAATGTLVGFTRVLTDFVYKALVFDVVVDAARRGEGLGEILMRALDEHPRLRGVEHVELYCLPELEPFYERWGFTSDLGKLRFMRLLRAAGGDSPPS